MYGNSLTELDTANAREIPENAYKKILRTVKVKVIKSGAE